MMASQPGQGPIPLNLILSESPSYLGGAKTLPKSPNLCATTLHIDLTDDG